MPSRLLISEVARHRATAENFGDKKRAAHSGRPVFMLLYKIDGYYFLLLKANPARLRSPVPRASRLPGSGTGAAVETTSVSVTPR